MSELKRAAFFGIGEGVRTPVDSPTYFGLSSQPEELGEGIGVGCSESLSSESGPQTDCPVFSEITRGALAGLDIVGFSSILGSSRPASRCKGPSQILELGILAAVVPAFTGGLKGFSRDPG